MIQEQPSQQAQQAWQAPPRSYGAGATGGKSAFGAVLLWGVIFALPITILQLMPFLFPRLAAALGWRDITRSGTALLILGLIALVCSFLAALLASRATGRLGPGIVAGVLARLLSGLAGLTEVIITWHNVLAHIDRPAFQLAARQAIGRTLVDLVVSLILCAIIALLGALAGRRRTSTNPASIHNVAYNSLSSVAPQPYSSYNASGPNGRAPGGMTALPPTPTPNGWQFTPYDPANGNSQSSSYRQWHYGQPGQEAQTPQTAQWQQGYAPAPSGYQSPTGGPSALTPGDAPTQWTTGDAPTALIPEDTSLPLPYSSTGQEPPRLRP